MTEGTTRLTRERDWRLLVVGATHPERQGGGRERTQLGAIVMAAIGKKPPSPPELVGKATITSDGMVMCDFIDPSGTYHYGAFVCSDRDMVRNIVGLANHCNLSNDEKVAFLAMVNNWIGKDHRSKTRIQQVMVIDQ